LLPNLTSFPFNAYPTSSINQASRLPTPAAATAVNPSKVHCTPPRASTPLLLLLVLDELGDDDVLEAVLEAELELEPELDDDEDPPLTSAAGPTVPPCAVLGATVLPTFAAAALN